MVNVIAIGDSIMWGQGNDDKAKFVNLVCAWLQGKGFQSALQLRAHSGAIAAATAHDRDPGIWGEVPESAPSVLAQCDRDDVDPKQVQLVLLNGGINDVSAFHIVVGNPFDLDGVDKLQRATRDVFTGPVYRLLLRTLERYPLAKVVLLGYYPIVSAESSGRELVKLMKHLPRPVGVPSTLDWVVEHLADEMIDLAIAVEKRRMVEQCTAFHELSSSILRGMVAALPASARARVRYVDPDFKDDNAFAAPNTWLWSGSDDPLHGDRLERYAEEVRKAPLDWPVYTPLASICHPNVSGSNAYAEAITNALAELGFAK
jgi:hypothetical protein